MTTDEQGKEIATRITRLSSIRGELVVKMAAMHKNVELLDAVGRAVHETHVWPPPDYWIPVEPWPTKESVDMLANEISDLRKEADTLIGELKGLGCDPDLFTINGD